MSKKLDQDIKVLRACVRALEKSSSPRMLKANVEYLLDRYVMHPHRHGVPVPPADMRPAGLHVTREEDVMPKEKAFPQVIYVGWEYSSHGEEPYLTANVTHAGMEVSNDDRKIAVYELKTVKTLKNRSTLE